MAKKNEKEIERINGVLKPVEFAIYLALLNSRDFADAVTEKQMQERAKRISNYVPYIAARAREIGWVE